MIPLHYYSEKDSTSYFFVDGKKLEDRIGSGISTFLSVDGTSAAVIAATALYRVDANGIILVYPAAVTRAVLSMDGKSILFATATKAFLYSSDTGETTEFEGIEAETSVKRAEGRRPISVPRERPKRTARIHMRLQFQTERSACIALNMLTAS